MPVNPGQSFKSILKRQELNKLLGTEKYHRPSFLPEVSTPDQVIITGYNPTGGSLIEMYEPAVILNSATELTSDGYGKNFTAVNVAKPTTSASSIKYHHRWGIALEPIDAGHSGKILMSGLTWAKVTYTIGTRVDIDDTTGGLRTWEAGRGLYCHLNSIEELDNDDYRLIHLESEQKNIQWVTYSGNIASMGTVNATCLKRDYTSTSTPYIPYSPTQTIPIWNEHPTKVINSTNKLGVQYTDRRWVILTEFCS